MSNNSFSSFSEKEETPMTLSKIGIKNFKCFKSLKEIELKPLTILTGANSSGKSSLIYSILGALQSKEFPMSFSTNGKYVNMGDFKDIAHRHISSSEIELSYEFKSPPKNIAEKITTIWKRDTVTDLPYLHKLTANNFYYNLNLEKINSKYVFNFNYNAKKDPDNDRDYRRFILNSVNSVKLRHGGLRKNKKFLRNRAKFANSFLRSYRIKNVKFDTIEQITEFYYRQNIGRIPSAFTWLKTYFNKFNASTNFISSFRLQPLRTYLERAVEDEKVTKYGEGYLDQVNIWETKKSPKFKELIKLLNEIELLADIKTNRLGGGRFETHIAVKKGGIKSSITDVGFGISQFLPIIVADLQLENNSTLFISQPEIHINPSVQSLFGDYLTKQMREKKKNYIIETHSEYLINKVRLSITKGEIKEEDVALYHLEPIKDDIKIHELKLLKNGEIKDAPEDFFRTYMIDVMNIAFATTK